MAHPHAARLTARGQGRWLRLASGVAEGARRVGGASGSAGASGAVEGARRVGGAFRVGGGSAARFRGGEVFGTLEEERRVCRASGRLRLLRRRGSGERRARGGSPGLVVTRIGGGSGREGSAAVGAPGSMVLRSVCFPEACGGGSLM